MQWTKLYILNWSLIDDWSPVGADAEVDEKLVKELSGRNIALNQTVKILQQNTQQEAIRDI